MFGILKDFIWGVGDFCSSLLEECFESFGYVALIIAASCFIVLLIMAPSPPRDWQDMGNGIERRQIDNMWVYRDQGSGSISVAPVCSHNR